MSQKKVIELAKLLKVKPEKVIHFLQVPLGKKVSQGDILAQKKQLFSSKKITSPIAGVLKKLDLDTGNLIIVDHDEEPKTDLEKKVKTSKKTHQEQLTITFGWGEAEGQLIIVKQTLKLEDLKADNYEDKIILAEAGIAEPGVVFKAEVLGAAGLIIISSQVNQNVWADVAEASEIGVVFVGQTAKESLAKLKDKQIDIKAASGEINVS